MTADKSASLQRLLEKKHLKVDVINCGVVGYSTLQEKLFYEKFIKALHPNIVLINFCSNDWLPTEDPFGNLRNIYLNYLEMELEKHESAYSVFEQKILGLIIQNFSKKDEKVWSMFEMMMENPDIEPVLRKVLLERPIQQLSSIMSANKTTLIYLFIPDTFPNKKNNQTVAELQKFMKRKNIKYIDFSYQLIDTNNGMLIPNINEGVILDLSESKMFGIFQYKGLRSYNPVENIRRISLFVRFKYLHLYKNYLDPIGHLSNKGHSVVANRIAAFLEH